MQVLDEEEGPSTKRDYEISTVPVGRALVGKSTDFLGRQESGSQQLGGDVELPLFNEQVPMDDRAQINEPLFTGLKVCALVVPSNISVAESSVSRLSNFACPTPQSGSSTLLHW